MHTDATLLANNTQHCCDLLRPFAWALKEQMYKSFWQLVKLHTFPSPKHRGRGGRGEHLRRAEINPLLHRVYVVQCHFLYVMHVLLTNSVIIIIIIIIIVITMMIM